MTDAAVGIYSACVLCDRPYLALGLCRLHYARLRRNGDPFWEGESFPLICTLEGCERPYSAHGFCTLHARRWRLYGDPLARPGRTYKQRELCTVENCGKVQHANLLCKGHDARRRRHGNPEGGRPGMERGEQVKADEGYVTDTERLCTNILELAARGFSADEIVRIVDIEPFLVEAVLA